MVSQGLIQLEEHEKATEQSEELVCEPRTGDTATTGAEITPVDKPGQIELLQREAVN